MKAYVGFLLFVGYCLSVCTAPVLADELADIRALAADKEFEQALLRLEQLLDEQPEHVEARLFEGVILTRHGKVNEAIAAFQTLSVEFPELPEPHNNLAVLYASEQRYDDARMSLLRALELQPRYDTAYENLGDVYAKLAAIAYDRAFQLNRTNQRAQEKSRQLTGALALDDTAVTQSGPEESTAVESTTAPASDQPEVGVANADSELNTRFYCYTAGTIIEDEKLAQVSAWLDEHGANASRRSAFEQVHIGYRVFLPPLESGAAAQVQIAQMRNEGIKDINRMSGNGIALGVYGTRDAADRRSSQLEAMGYKPEIEQRTREQPVWYVEANAPAPLDETAFRAQFPDTTFSGASCPKP